MRCVTIWVTAWGMKNMREAEEERPGKYGKIFLSLTRCSTMSWEVGWINLGYCCPLYQSHVTNSIPECVKWVVIYMTVLTLWWHESQISMIDRSSSCSATLQLFQSKTISLEQGSQPIKCIYNSVFSWLTQPSASLQAVKKNVLCDVPIENIATIDGNEQGARRRRN